MKRELVGGCLLSICLAGAQSLVGIGAAATDSGAIREHEWPPVICFSVADAQKLVKAIDRAPQPPSPNVVFRVVREKSVRCTTVHLSLTFGPVITTLLLENHEYDIVGVELNGRTWYSFAIGAGQRS